MFSGSDLEQLAGGCIRSLIVALIAVIALTVAATLGVQWLYHNVSIDVKINDQIQTETSTTPSVSSDSQDAEGGR